MQASQLRFGEFFGVDELFHAHCRKHRVVSWNTPISENKDTAREGEKVRAGRSLTSRAISDCPITAGRRARPSLETIAPRAGCSRQAAAAGKTSAILLRRPRFKSASQFSNTNYRRFAAGGRERRFQVKLLPLHNGCCFSTLQGSSILLKVHF